MINVQVKADRDPQALAELIAQAHGTAEVEGKHADQVNEVRQELRAERPSRQELETVNFQRLDSENDWTDV